MQRLELPEDQLALSLARIDMLEAMHGLRRLADVSQSNGAVETLNRASLRSVSSEAIEAQQAVVAVKRERFIALQEELRPKGKRADTTPRIDPDALAQARQKLQEVLQNGSEEERRAAIKEYQESIRLLRTNP